MGASASITEEKGRARAQFSAKEVAEEVAALGDAYLPYAKQAEVNGIDEAFLMEYTEENLSSLFDDLNVTSNMHKVKLSLTFKSFRESVGSSKTSNDENVNDGPTNVVTTQELSPLPTITKGKRYRGFLSHFKYECGTEARLVHSKMGEMMPGEDIFLDSGT